MSMQSDSRNQDIFEMAFAGIPRVAELIAALRLEDRIRALEAAEQRYKQLARDLGVSAQSGYKSLSAAHTRADNRTSDSRS